MSAADSGSAARWAAARIVDEVARRRRSLDAARERLLAQMPHGDTRDEALVSEMAFGTLRWYHRLAAQAAALLHRPLRRADRELEALILVGLYQLAFMRIPAHAAVNATVAATAQLGKAHASGLVNAVMRNYLRRRETLERDADAAAQTKWSHPDWLLDRLQAQWPDHWQDMAAANNARAPMVLRVNARRGDRRDYLARLERQSVMASAHPRSPVAVVLDRPRNVGELPGFDAGEVSVQDTAAQQAALLLAPAPGARVLDACAAPGGKTAHLLEQWPEMGELVAVESDGVRFERLEAGLRRLALDATLVHGDATRPEAWWDGRAFDCVLLDAPCTGTGVIRRHPDIKLLRRDDDVAGMAMLQARLLDALWPLLRRGGKLLYVTCSVLDEENAANVSAFAARTPDALMRAPALGCGVPRGAGLQILPGEEDMDGFFYAWIDKR
jgi:16S rRNA (cytosine967-C5)-methyltransferase